jgi:hypothetical protein
MKSGQQQGNGSYDQPTLEGCATDSGAELVLENCVVITEPRFDKTRSRWEWLCGIHAGADLWNPERNDTYMLHAQREESRMASGLRLRPGDRVGIKGVALPRQEVTLSGGGTQVLNHLYVSEIQVISRAPRVIKTNYVHGLE